MIGGFNISGRSTDEADWLQTKMLPATLQYFGCHFDENDPGQRLAPTRPGEIYARESALVHFPQPLSKQSDYAAYLAHLMDKPITDKQVVVLRAMFGNQKAVLE
ncbi:hypothetical protein VLK31_19245 [Variovorax sp. H27-G14]|uniref:hypothetical protein n=1 Tax=Variovorax sp. H27-G14 TaxID=3111914 RepID=UPI0038FC13F5